MCTLVGIPDFAEGLTLYRARCLRLRGDVLDFPFAGSNCWARVLTSATRRRESGDSGKARISLKFLQRGEFWGNGWIRDGEKVVVIRYIFLTYVCFISIHWYVIVLKFIRKSVIFNFLFVDYWVIKAEFARKLEIVICPNEWLDLTFAYYRRSQEISRNEGVEITFHRTRM